MSYWVIKCKDKVAVVEANSVKGAVDKYFEQISSDIQDGYTIACVTDIITENLKYALI